MSILFGRGSYADRMRFVLTATRQHATNLCKFASLYKAVTILLRRTRGGKPKGGDAFLAGVVGGYAVFGERNAVNEQIVLYCVARCVSALLPRQQVASNWPSDRPIPTESKTFSVFAAVVWGSVMWLFDQRRQNLQGGLVNSMDYLYVNAEKWQKYVLFALDWMPSLRSQFCMLTPPLAPPLSLFSLRTLIWHNK
ncbi:hypothetical protein FA09DRAFT_332684 [Tilletiopsis washingtonensis]|uniref:Peroxisomal membrane protein 4 n=1 Tax=Tilletiopsis washingtonensis TaxID=58919 RepID=A0A316Z136_9BASI|nr:hypothetical protein FA09DRAFT_332684 [Tilletiopsis washingtonensis]PWN94774.1 hypothetical protein FA09DRAFT_332684 [Tilletiopsis washingtonensis]